VRRAWPDPTRRALVSDATTRMRPARFASHPVGEALTARELEILELIADGLPNREIAKRLILAEDTVKSHVRHLLAKLDADSRAHAVGIGFRQELIA
jgi:DNA-binding NarL/FixJ family response regulator